MGATSIEWTERTWNPVRGCSRVSEGCRNCYAERQAARFSGKIGTLNEDPYVPEYGPFHRFVQITNGHPQWTGKVELIEKHLEDPLHWRKPCKVFVNSMSDLFHEALPDEAIDRVFAVMALCPGHTFQILTKRPGRMLQYLTRGVDDEFMRETMDEAVQEFQACHANMHPPGRWPLPNVWLGVSVEDQKTADERIPLLLQTPAAIRFVSYEPALGPVDFRRWLTVTALRDRMLDWIIIGAESGPGARAFDIQWARNTIEQCKAAGVACFLKQLGAHPQEVAYPQTVTLRETQQWMDSGWTCITDENGQHWRRCYKLKDRKGGDWLEWPEDLRVREFPEVRNAARV